MRILYINTVFGRGSTGSLIKALGGAIEQSGGEYKVAYGRGDFSDTEHTYRIGGKASIYTHALLARLTDRSGFYSKNATRKLIQFIRGYNPDIIHLHNLHGYYINIEILFAYLKNEYKGKIIWTLHDCWSFTGHCCHYSFVQCDRWKTGCGHCPQRKEYPASMCFDASRKNLSAKERIYQPLKDRIAVVTVSEWLKKQAQQSIFEGFGIRCIYNGIDTKRFTPITSDIKKCLKIEGKYMILCVSDGWNKRKGFDKVFVLNNSINKDKSVIVMVGLSKKQIETLPSGIIGLERTWNQDELIALYGAADVFFNPSMEETFGLVTAEAMSCGTPAVVFDTSACPEIVGDKDSGSVLSLNDSIPEVLSKILLNKSDFTVQCRSRVNTMFRMETMINNYMVLYGE